MGKVAVDFSDVKGFEAAPAGRYEVVIDKVTYQPSKSSEHYLLAWEMTVVQPEEYEGKKFWLRTSLAPNAKWRLQQILTTFGIDASANVEFDVDDGSNLLISPALAGQRATAVVSVGEYNNRPNNDVQDLIGQGAQNGEAEFR